MCAYIRSMVSVTECSFLDTVTKDARFAAAGMWVAASVSFPFSSWEYIRSAFVAGGLRTLRARV